MPKVKKKKEVLQVIPRESRDTKDYNEALRDGSWPKEREWADSIMASNQRKGLKFKLDKLTRGRGNCFHIAVLQQMNRSEIFEKLNDAEKRLAETMDHNSFREKVVFMIQNSNNPEVKEMEVAYNIAKEAVLPTDVPMIPWSKYWLNMMKDGIWAEVWFIKATAMLLRVDIQMMDTTAEASYTIHGCDDPRGTLYIGVFNNTHFQSLLKDEPKEDKDFHFS